MLRIRLVGELRLDLDERRLEAIASRRARSLLAWLAYHPGLHPRARVASVFWPDVLDDSARASLRTTLATLRRDLGEEAAAACRRRSRSAGHRGRPGRLDRRAGDRPPRRRRVVTTRRWRSRTATCSPTWTTTGCSRSARRAAIVRSSFWRSAARRPRRPAIWRRRSGAPVAGSSSIRCPRTPPGSLMRRLARDRRRRGRGRVLRGVPLGAAARARHGAVGRDARRSSRSCAPTAGHRAWTCVPSRSPRRSRAASTRRSSAAASRSRRCGTRGGGRAQAPRAS